MPARTRLQLAGWPVKMAHVAGLRVAGAIEGRELGAFQGGGGLGEVGVGLVLTAGAAIADAGDLAVALQLGAHRAVVDHHVLAAVVGVLDRGAVALPRRRRRRCRRWTGACTPAARATGRSCRRSASAETPAGQDQCMSGTAGEAADRRSRPGRTGAGGSPASMGSPAQMRRPSRTGAAIRVGRGDGGGRRWCRRAAGWRRRPARRRPAATSRRGPGMMVRVSSTPDLYLVGAARSRRELDDARSGRCRSWAAAGW